MNREAGKSKRSKGIEPPRGTLQRVHGQVTRITAYLPPPQARSLRVRAAEQGRTVSAVVSDALELAELSAG
jgi:hypothetical protein